MLIYLMYYCSSISPYLRIYRSIRFKKKALYSLFYVNNAIFPIKWRAADEKDHPIYFIAFPKWDKRVDK